MEMAGGCVKITCLAFVLLYFGLGFCAADDFSYAAVPMNLSFWGEDPHFVHMYISGNQDTAVDIIIPDTTFAVYFNLNQDNQWSWRRQYHMDEYLISALHSGFRIKATKPITIYVAQNSTTPGSLTTFNVLPMTDESRLFLLSPYTRNNPNPGFEPVYAIAAGDHATDVEISKYDIDTGTPILVDQISLESFEIHYAEIEHPQFDYGIGLEVNSSRPITVFTGNKKTQVSYQYAFELSTYIQLTDIYHLQNRYVVGPLLDDYEHNGYSVLITFIQDTETNIWFDDMVNSVDMERSSHSCICTAYTSRCGIACGKPLSRGAYVEVKASNSKSPIIVDCSVPCQVVLVKQSQTSGVQKPLGYISPQASPQVLANPVSFVVPDIEMVETVQKAWINIAVPTKSVSGVVLDGRSFSLLQAEGRAESTVVLDWSVITIPVAPGIHSVHHRDSTVSISVHLHGVRLYQDCSSCTSDSFGFPVVFSDTEYVEGPNVSPSTEAKMSGEAIALLSLVAISTAILIVVLVFVICIFKNVKLQRSSHNNPEVHKNRAFHGDTQEEKKNRYLPHPHDMNKRVSDGDSAESEIYEDV